MIREKAISSVLDELKHRGAAEINYLGSEVDARYGVDSARLSLTTMVYRGGSFVPQSVRDCLYETPPLPPTDISTSLQLDEKSGQIHLQYVGALEPFDSHYFVHILEQFCFLADEWRTIIDENDKRDLIHVRR